MGLGPDSPVCHTEVFVLHCLTPAVLQQPQHRKLLRKGEVLRSTALGRLLFLTLISSVGISTR